MAEPRSAEVAGPQSLEPLEITVRQAFATPALLGLLALGGLVLALLADDAWHWLSWAALSAPPIVVLRRVGRRAA